MARNNCKAPCVTTISGTTRQKWNYVRNLYQPSYLINSNYDWADQRAISDPSWIADNDRYNDMYAEDLSAWINRGQRDTFEKFLQWRYRTAGTYQYANLPEYKANNHVGYCWMPCPYSTDATTVRRDIMLTGSDPNLTQVDHGDYYMRMDNRGRVYGWECTYDNCPHLLSTGKRYFYV